MIRDIIPHYLRRLSDKVFEGRNRTRIVMGTDRISELSSGWGDGGEGDVDSGTIDIVVNYQDEKPNLVEDASRIYISGKTNPDQSFNLEAGAAVEGEPSVISISDNNYAIGRTRLKLIVGSTHIILNGEGVTIKTNEDTNIETGGDINIETGGDINIDAGGSVNISANGAVNVSSPTSVTVDCPNIKLGSDGAFDPVVLQSKLLIQLTKIAGAINSLTLTPTGKIESAVPYIPTPTFGAAKVKGE